MPTVKKKKKTTLDGINSRLNAADEKLVNLKKSNRGTSPMVQWLRLHIPNARGPGQGSQIPHAANNTQQSQINKQNK